jgi:hypothetical protein
MILSIVSELVPDSPCCPVVSSARILAVEHYALALIARSAASVSGSTAIIVARLCGVISPVERLRLDFGLKRCLRWCFKLYDHVATVVVDDDRPFRNTGLRRYHDHVVEPLLVAAVAVLSPDRDILHILHHLQKIALVDPRAIS